MDLRTAAGYTFPVTGSGLVAGPPADVLGRTVAVLLDGERPAGRHEATLDARALAAGVYVVRVTADGAPRDARAVARARPARDASGRSRQRTTSRCCAATAPSTRSVTT